MRILPVIAAIWISSASAQITITSANMPSANDTFRISMSSDTIDLSLTGANITWDFSYLTPDSQRVDTIFAVSSTPLAYQLYFNNPFDQGYYSDYASKGKDFNFQAIQITEVMDFFKNTSSALEQTGFGANINGIPSSNKYQPKELIYKFPLTYGVTDSSDAEFGIDIPNTFYYGQFRHRVHHCDGYGTLITPFGTFDALRIKTTLQVQDTIYVDSLGFGFKIPRPDEYIYTWITTSDKYPVLKVTATDMFGSPVVSSVEYRDHKTSSPAVSASQLKNKKKVDVQFNTQNQTFVIRQSALSFKNLVIFDVSGKMVMQKGIYQMQENFHLPLSKGVYLYILTGNGMPVTGKIAVP